MKKIILPLFAIAFSAFIPSASAQDMATPGDSDGTGHIGVGALIVSEYIGSADEDITPAPYLSFTNINGFDLFGTALSYRAVDTGTGQGFGKWSLRAGPSVVYARGRDSEDSPNLIGFEDVDGSFVTGGYVRTTIGPVGFLVNAGKDIAGGHGGVVGNASIGTQYTKGKFSIQPSVSVNWGDNDFSDSFFSVTADQAASSPLAAFDAGSGIYSYSAQVVSWVEIKENWALSLIGSYSWYTDDATDSPILNANDGSDNGLVGLISLSRRFDTNSWGW